MSAVNNVSKIQIVKVVSYREVSKSSGNGDGIQIKGISCNISNKKSKKRTKDEEKLVNQNKIDADRRINSSSQKKLGRDVASARAEENGIQSKEHINVGQYKKGKVPSGVIRLNNGNYQIKDKIKYLDHLEELYEKTDSKNPLNEQMRKRIEEYIGSNINKIWDNMAGFPGMHAEVRAVNELLNKKIPMNKIKVSTHKVKPDSKKSPCKTQGKEFEACSNCTGILNGHVNNIITGVKDNVTN